MNEKELHERKLQAQLDEWQAEVERLRAQATSASADAQLTLNERIEALQRKIDDGKTKLEAAADVGEDTWASVKDRVESAWDSAKSAVGEAVDKTKK